MEVDHVTCSATSVRIPTRTHFDRRNPIYCDTVFYPFLWAKAIDARDIRVCGYIGSALTDGVDSSGPQLDVVRLRNIDDLLIAARL
jgi:hypothetical protein